MIITESEYGSVRKVKFEGVKRRKFKLEIRPFIEKADKFTEVYYLKVVFFEDYEQLGEVELEDVFPLELIPKDVSISLPFLIDSIDYKETISYAISQVIAKKAEVSIVQEGIHINLYLQYKQFSTKGGVTNLLK